MARYSGAHPILAPVPALPRSIRVREAEEPYASIRIGNARPDLPPPFTPPNGVPLVSWETAPSTPSPPVAIVSDSLAARANDDVWGPMQVHDPISIFPEEHIVPIDPTTTLPGIEGFLDAFED